MDDNDIDFTDDCLLQYASEMDSTNINKEDIIQETEMETLQEHLSQSFSQLSVTLNDDDENQPQSQQIALKNPTGSTTNKRLLLQTSPVSKKKKIDNNHNEAQQINRVENMNDRIPQYLSLNYQKFQDLLKSILSSSANSCTMQDLQEIAILLYNIIKIDIQMVLWNTYLQSGTGKLENNHCLYVWPSDIKECIIKKAAEGENKQKNQQQENENKKRRISNIDEIDHQDCYNYVMQHLEQFMQHQIDYKKQLEVKKYNLYNFFTSEIENMIIRYIEKQQEMCYMRIDVEKKIALIQFNYKDQLLEFEYKQLASNQKQLELLEVVTQSKFEQEKTKYDLLLLKERYYNHNYVPPPINSLQLPLLITLNTISNEKDSQNLLNHYNKIVQQTKLELMTLSIAIAEVQMKENQLKFKKDVFQMASALNRKEVTQSMIDIIQRYLKHIDERFQYMYNIKMRYLNQPKQ